MHIKNQIFYHIHIKTDGESKWVDTPFEVGKKYVFGNTINRFAFKNQSASRKVRIDKTNMVYSMTLFCQENAKLALYKTKNPNTDDIYLDFPDEDAYKKLIFCQDSLIEWSLKNLRENIFEEERVKNFKNLPSRLKCLFVIPDNEECIAHWNKVFNKNERTLYKMKLNGNMHYGNQKLLIMASNSMENWRMIANQYWNGIKPPYPEDIECLFAGNAEILEAIPQ